MNSECLGMLIQLLPVSKPPKDLGPMKTEWLQKAVDDS